MSSYGTLETNIIINNSDALLLQPGERGTALFQPRGDAGAGKMSRHHLDAGVIVIRRRRSPQPHPIRRRQRYPPQTEQPAEPDVRKDNDLQEHGLTLNVSELNTASWYQRVLY